MKMREHLQRNLFNSVHIQHKHFHFYVFLSQLYLDICIFSFSCDHNMCILYSVVVTLESRCGSLARFDSGLALVTAKE